jgi:ABC-type dipeptide/oligopeptide/nickel transport system permease component
MRVVRRLVGAVAMIYVVTSGIFFLVHIMPGNPSRNNPSSTWACWFTGTWGRR